MRGRRPQNRIQLIIWPALVIVTVLLNAAARTYPDFAEWYAVNIYPLLVGSVGRIMSAVPFSAAEILLYVLITAVIACIILIILRRMRVGVFLAAAVKTVIILALVFTLGCGINYHRLTFSEKAGFEMTESSEVELVSLCLFLAGELNESSSEITVDEDGMFMLDVDAETEAVIAMQSLGEIYGDLSGYYPLAKKVLFWPILSYQQLEGIYSPFTVEANYNGAAPDQDIPSSVCHELSHLKGFMREDEANFIAYLACRVSESPAFNYSGTMTAYIYSINALYADDPQAALEVRDTLCEQALRDLSAHNAYWDSFEGAAAETAEKVNDAYLKANAQEEGTKSYGRMVDLMLAWYKAEAAG